jgi:short-subunit dehydrogenase
MAKSKQIKRTVIITGASHGIGLAAKQLFEKRGDIVFDLSRTSGTDITNPEQVRAAFEQIRSKHGHIDILINNAGFGISGSAECTALADMKKLFDVNFFGMAVCCSAVLPYMRAQKNRPKIINVSSVAGGVYSLPFQAFYSASKAAVNAYTNALRTEIKPHKVTACVVQLGDVKTDFTAARQKNTDDDPAYEYRCKRAIKKYEHAEENGYSTKFIARKLYKLSCKKNPPPIVTFGIMFKFLVFLKRIAPQRLVNWVVGKMYGQ